MLEGQNLIYSGFVDGILDQDNTHRLGSEEAFSDKYDDRAMQMSIYDLDILDLPNLESEVSAKQRRNQTGQGLKILTPDQMLSILPITLGQL